MPECVGGDLYIFVKESVMIAVVFSGIGDNDWKRWNCCLFVVIKTAFYISYSDTLSYKYCFLIFFKLYRIVRVPQYCPYDLCRTMKQKKRPFFLINDMSVCRSLFTKVILDILFSRYNDQTHRRKAF